MSVATNPPPSTPPQALKLESIACIDTATLSQSELHALSLCSLSAFDLRSTHDLVTPKIERALFNESAGSRRQTYSRPRRQQFATGSPTGHRRRVAGLLPTPKLPPVLADDPENVENRMIIDYLKQLIREDPNFDQVELAPPSVSSVNGTALESRGEIVARPEMSMVNFGGERKRKRGRKPKVKVYLEECYREKEVVNKNGVAIDLSALANAEDPFAEELRRRTVGLQSEEELLGFLRDLGGQWGSRRKKRKIVDAGDFGDVLPVGWKLLLGLKRKDGRAWIYCRRYISPSGHQFVTCREVSSYLQSIFGYNDAQLAINRRGENMLQDNRVTIESSAGVTHENQEQRKIVTSNPTLPSSSISNERVKEVALLGIDNLADVQIHDLFECHKCSMTFDEKDSYLQHVLSFHQRTTRRYRLGSSVGDGVIIKDGKFECQFCHKVFLERRRYNGHVGIHVRNYVRGVEESPAQTNVQRRDKSPVREDMPLRISKMDALIEIAQNSIMENSDLDPHSKTNHGSSPDKLNVILASEPAVGNFDHDMNFESPLRERQIEYSITDKIMGQDLNQQDGQHVNIDGKLQKIDDNKKVLDVKMDTCLDYMDLLSVNKQNVNASGSLNGKENMGMIVDNFDQSGVDLEGVSHSPLLPLSGKYPTPEAGSIKNSGSFTDEGHSVPNEDDSSKTELRIALGGNIDASLSNNVQERVMSISEDNVIQSGISNPSMSMSQSRDVFPHSNDLSDKG
ncbi:hypothetical protein L6164_036337 [Bauhinia variegata]|uniref:Uncharacterized protein n=1 Tax=Bauhinia variegata TaxID=167791 RepID=A0ACB9KGV2_BAUVA|nr:hypothetical protein L6164_036337 [Bauhinia variegata]